MVPADSDRITRVPPYSGYLLKFKGFRLQDFHLLWYNFPENFSYLKNFLLLTRGPTTPRHILVWAVPFSLATTKGIDFSFFSSDYLDVSVHRVAFSNTMYSCYDNSALPLLGFPIRKSLDQSVLTAPQSISLFVTSFLSF